MDVKKILKQVWKESKLSFFNLLYSLILTLVFSFLRLGNNLLAYPRKKMESTIRSEFIPSKEEFQELEWFATYAIKIFQYENKELLKLDYPEFHDHIVGEFREARYTILRIDNKVFVSIRGSTTTQNWIDGANSQITYDNELASGVHSGYALVSKGIADIVGQYCGKNDEIYLTGGSMGGATATLTGWYLQDRGYNVVKIWSFANPRVADGEYGHLNVVNVLDLRDPVVFLPAFSPFTRYRHQGRNLVLTNGTWYWYEDNWRSDLLTSLLFLTEKIDPKTHTGYANELLALKSKLEY